RGIASGFWFNIGGESAASVHINEDGTASVVEGNPDIGGSRASMAMMAAEVLGVPYEHVRPIIADTSSTGYCFLTGGSRVTFATGICDVEVDRETGYVKVLRYTAVQDVGRAIHPSYVEGQIQGGVTQGIGWALNEEYVYDKDGRLENPGFLDYRIPVASDLPMIETVMVEV